MNYENILFYLTNTDGTSDKIYGAIEVAGHVFGFYGKRNPAENPKEKCPITVIDIGKNCETLDEEYSEAHDILKSKIAKGYKAKYIAKTFIPNISYFGHRYFRDIPEDIINENYHNFDNTISKKLSKRVMLRK